MLHQRCSGTRTMTAVLTSESEEAVSVPVFPSWSQVSVSQAMEKAWSQE